MEHAPQCWMQQLGSASSLFVLRSAMFGAPEPAGYTGRTAPCWHLQSPIELTYAWRRMAETAEQGVEGLRMLQSLHGGTVALACIIWCCDAWLCMHGHVCANKYKCFSYQHQNMHGCIKHALIFMIPDGAPWCREPSSATAVFSHNTTLPGTLVYLYAHQHMCTWVFDRLRSVWYGMVWHGSGSTGTILFILQVHLGV